jgi:hypothetical protein
MFIVGRLVSSGKWSYLCKDSNGIVPTENPIRSENTEVLIICEIMVATTISSLFVALFCLVSLQFSNPRCPTSGDPRASSPTCGLSKERAASLVPPALRPALLGCVVPILVRLGAMSRDGSARHGSWNDWWALSVASVWTTLSCGTRDRCDELCTTILATISGHERI